MRLQDRVPIRIPRSMMNEVDRIVSDHPELGYNRQQFVESALREKIEHIIVLESASSSRLPMTLRSHVRLPHRSLIEG
jgi:metal-responsive CopG/Arc/MetJ family transcriptional regulator